jgi:hypothetical protein
MVRFASLVSLAILLAAAAAPARAGEPGREPGVYWESSVEMQMAGFSMPAQTTKLCLPKRQWDEPPKSGNDDKCKMTDVKRSGSRMTWKMKCDDGTTGEGDLTSTPESYSGNMTMHTQGQDMRMKLNGRKVGGDCDAGETKRKVAEAQGQLEEARVQQAASQEQMCKQGVDEMQVAYFVPMGARAPATCPDSAKFCSRLDTRDGLRIFKDRSSAPDARGKAEKVCKKDLAAIQGKHCAAISKEQEKSKKLDADTVEFVFAFCPDTAKAIAKRECAGRKFTSMPNAQREFCTRYTRDRLEAPPADESPAGKTPSADDVKSRIMKGIFGR